MKKHILRQREKESLSVSHLHPQACTCTGINGWAHLQNTYYSCLNENTTTDCIHMIKKCTPFIQGGVCFKPLMKVLWVQQEIPVHCGCSDIIVPSGNSWTNRHFFLMKSLEVLQAAAQNAYLQGMFAWMSCGCLLH